MATGTEARAAAARMVQAVTDGGIPLADQLAKGALAGLDPADRARSQRLALTTLRSLGQADRVLSPHMRKLPPPMVRAVMRLAVSEMLAEGAPAHAVVGAAVAIVRSGGRKTEGFSGMVNAVLRRAAEVTMADFAELESQPLPGWLRGRLMSAWGKKATMAMERAHARGAPVDLTPRDGDAGALAARLGGLVLPTGSVRLQAHGQISALPGYAAGDWWVQDAAAALPARVLAAQPGERVLDLCAAPGGKTMQLAAAGAEVTALDLSPDRMARLHENLLRCGLAAQTVVADALDWLPGAPFDAILLDAPCSATGTIRRHPDLPFVKDASGLKELAILQAALIDRAVGMIRPGGRLVFATCSLLPEEGEALIHAALARHADLAADPGAFDLPAIHPDWRTGPAGLRLRPDNWPELGGMDGFFIAALRRT